MRSIQTSHTFPLSSVKPFGGLLQYRERCLRATREALSGTTHAREQCPADWVRLEPFGQTGELAYVRCPQCGSLFLAEVPEPVVWEQLRETVRRLRQSSDAFHVGLTKSRTAHVSGPKLEWIQDTLRLQRLVRPTALEVTAEASEFTQSLRDSGSCAEIATIDERDLTGEDAGGSPSQIAVLFESLDRSEDPAKLLRAVWARLEAGGLLFVTGLVASGFDVAVLGLRNLYLCPPDRTNCFSLEGLTSLITRAGFTPVEVSTPGVLDVEIVQAHHAHDPALPLSTFERQIIGAERETRDAFQVFLQQQRLSSFARIVGRKPS